MALSKLLPELYLAFPQPDTDILICASDTSLSGHYYATGRTTPTRTVPVSHLLFFFIIIIIIGDMAFWTMLNIIIEVRFFSFLAPLPLISLPCSYPMVVRLPSSLLLSDSKAYHHNRFFLRFYQTISTCELFILLKTFNSTLYLRCWHVYTHSLRGHNLIYSFITSR